MVPASAGGASRFYYPNKLGRIILLALEEIIGQMYGPRGGCGLALRSGRACFKHGLKEFGPALGIADLAFRLLPLSMKLKAGAEVFAETFNKYTDQVVRVVEEEERILWTIERCPVCWKRHTPEPCCFLAVGILQESLTWVSEGKNFNVEEIACIARGDPTCTIAVDRQPLD